MKYAKIAIGVIIPIIAIALISSIGAGVETILVLIFSFVAVYNLVTSGYKAFIFAIIWGVAVVIISSFFK